MTVPFGAIVRGAIGVGRLLDSDGDAAGAAQGIANALEGLAGSGPVQLGAVVKFEKIDEVLSGLEKLALDLRPVFAARIDPEVSGFFERQFETEGKAGGKPWPRLSNVTKKLRTRTVNVAGGGRATTNRAGRARYGFSAVLRDTGRMAESFIRPGAPEGIREIGPLSYARGSAVPYAALHQEGYTVTKMFGRPVPPKKVPARPVVPAEMPAPVLSAFEGYLVKYLETGAP